MTSSHLSEDSIVTENNQESTMTTGTSSTIVLRRTSTRALLRAVKPDYKFNDILLQKFINRIMKQGKKSKACALVYSALDYIQQKKGFGATPESALEIFHEAVTNVRPTLEVRSKRVGGASYSVPIPVSLHRGQSLACRTITNAFRKRSEKTMPQRLGEELMDAAAGRGESYRWRENQHKMAAANQMFSGFIK
jgi:small subunit ribosomal protein S7